MLGRLTHLDIASMGESYPISRLARYSPRCFLALATPLTWILQFLRQDGDGSARSVILGHDLRRGFRGSVYLQRSSVPVLLVSTSWPFVPPPCTVSLFFDLVARYWGTRYGSTHTILHCHKSIRSPSASPWHTRSGFLMLLAGHDVG